MPESWRTELASPTLTTRGLEIGISGKQVAQCDDLTLEPGKVLVLVGKNGSGKSTFLRTIAGLIKPIAGEISFDGQPQNKVKTEKITAWLAQEEHLEFSWTVSQYVSLGRIAQNDGLNLTPADSQAVQAALLTTDCEALAERYYHELSGGERQRVRLARAIAQETPIILMDEPTTHLDIEHQIQILQLISRLIQDGKTIVISLHDTVQAKQIGTQFLLFNDHVATIADALNEKLLEQTLGVRFEQCETGQNAGLVFPIYTSG